ncbi:heavy metal translocating P-type ATPase [Miniphocaeibacter massiliensis]|uniref:heavy metal translocating P-type ATPase n=1 Tax=Miniphocaeibacter massiliensis TaxID=2041841 RepID=UPI000C1C6EDE|nr:heavy metal translocating P-type ATPase [Miniphocaeibacter massiliensis]
MEVYLRGLCCANCAAKIEREVQNLDNVKKASLNFVNKTLRLESENGKYEEILENSKKIVNRIEPDVGFEVLSDDLDLDELEEEKSSKIEVIKMAISAILLVASIFIENKNETIAFVLGIISYVIVGYEVLLTAVKNILKGEVFDENFLMSVASIGAIIIGEVTEGIAVMLLYSVGEHLQDLAVDNSTKSIKSLVKMKPTYGNLVIGNSIKKVNPKILNVGDIIKILPGEKVPVDSVVISGNSTLDTSSITGESVPVYVESGKEVISGSINNEGVIEAKVEKSFKDSTVSQILEMVQNASNRKSKTENFITVFARYYTPLVVFLAVIIAILPPLATGQSFDKWIYTALTFLVISCPCAMVISIPLTYFAAIGVGSKHGILIKGSNYVETMSQVDTIIFDKTGTLTRGEFKVINVIGIDNDKDYVVEIAKKLEENSNHPIATSIKEYHKKEVQIDAKNISEVPGRGIKGEIEGELVLLGNKKLLEENNIEVIGLESHGTVLYLSKGKKHIGTIEISDTVKDDTVKSLNKLKNLGINKLVMLTGDRKESSEHLAKELKIDEYKSELLPQDKVLEFEKIKNNSQGKVAFVGDGTNDAPVLRLSDVGISMGEYGSDAAIESSDVTIMGEEMYKIPLFYKIAKVTKKIAIQNIVFALGVKIAIMLLGVLGYANMWLAVFADVGVALLAVLNAMRVMLIKE